MYSEKRHLKTSYDRQIIALFWEMGFAESRGDVRCLTGSSQIAAARAVK